MTSNPHGGGKSARPAKVLKPEPQPPRHNQPDWVDPFVKARQDRRAETGGDEDRDPLSLSPMDQPWWVTLLVLFGIPPPSSLQAIEETIEEGRRSRFRYQLGDLLTAVGVAGFVGLLTFLFWRSADTRMSWFVPLVVLAPQVLSFLYALGYLARGQVNDPVRRAMGIAAFQAAGGTAGFILGIVVGFAAALSN